MGTQYELKEKLITYEDLKHRAVIQLYDVSGGIIPKVYPEDICVIIMYVEKQHKKLPRIHMVSYGSKTERDKNGTPYLIMGGNDNLLYHRNAAIGRRICPACLEQFNTKSYVWERGPSVGKCRMCDTRVDYIATAFPPYFYYYKQNEASSKQHIVYYNTVAHGFATTMKEALIHNETRDVALPTIIKTDGYGKLVVDCDMPAFYNPLAFSLNGMFSLTGTFGRTVYDFQAHLRN